MVAAMMFEPRTRMRTEQHSEAPHNFSYLPFPGTSLPSPMRAALQIGRSSSTEDLLYTCLKGERIWKKKFGTDDVLILYFRHTLYNVICVCQRSIL